MYKEIIERFIQAQKDARAAYAAAAAFEREQLPGLESYQYGVSVPDNIDTLKELRKFCYNLAGLVVNRARRSLRLQAPAWSSVTRKSESTPASISPTRLTVAPFRILIPCGLRFRHAMERVEAWNLRTGRRRIA
ncbi:hypothetical protein [Cupriavidus basilensis]